VPVGEVPFGTGMRELEDAIGASWQASINIGRVIPTMEAAESAPVPLAGCQASLGGVVLVSFPRDNFSGVISCVELATALGFFSGVISCANLAAVLVGEFIRFWIRSLNEETAGPWGDVWTTPFPTGGALGTTSCCLLLGEPVPFRLGDFGRQSKGTSWEGPGATGFTSDDLLVGEPVPFLLGDFGRTVWAGTGTNPPGNDLGTHSRSVPEPKA